MVDQNLVDSLDQSLLNLFILSVIINVACVIDKIIFYMEKRKYDSDNNGAAEDGEDDYDG